jgi:UDP-N-acetylglucosamine 2-epimerase (non-hydrolysing)
MEVGLKKILVVLGTRPEAIKLAPVILQLKKIQGFDVEVVSTGQHTNLVNTMLDLFSVQADMVFNTLEVAKTLPQVVSNVLKDAEVVIERTQPDLVIVQGDTASAFAFALAAFYNQIEVAHVEAGLRSYNKLSPFPEELNRVYIAQIAKYHFAPTEVSKKNLLKEGIEEDNIFVVGNTSIDALRLILGDERFNAKNVQNLTSSKKQILLTQHRRENFSRHENGVFKAVAQIAHEYGSNIEIIFPMHPNPVVREASKSYFENLSNIKLIEPLDYQDFSNLMASSYLIVTDSGGVQEEAPSLNVPALITRDTTERTEIVSLGAAKLVGVEEKAVFNAITNLLDDEKSYESMRHKQNPYGDGHSSLRISNVLVDKLQFRNA